MEKGNQHLEASVPDDDGFSDSTNISGDELDDDDGFGDSTNISGGELDDEDALVEDESSSRGPQSENIQANPANQKDTPAQKSDKSTARSSSWKKRSIYLVTVLGLIVAAIIGYQGWRMVSQPEPIEAAIQQPIKATVAPIKLDAFIIPYHNGNFSYISLDVSMDVPEGPMRTELISKIGLIRGRIYELLLVYIREIGDVPAPEKIKVIISKAVSTSLSKGEIGKLYLTQFLVI